MKFKIDWYDGHRSAQSPPNPSCPAGSDVDLTAGRTPACKVPLSYPAKRCGQYVIICDVCKIAVMVTTAGRADDPRSVTIACKRVLQ